MSLKYLLKSLIFSIKNLNFNLKRPSIPISTLTKYNSIKFPIHLNFPFVIGSFKFDKLYY